MTPTTVPGASPATPAPAPTGYDPASARRRIAEIADAPDAYDPYHLPPAHERLCRVLAAALLVEWPDAASGYGFLFRTLRAEVPRLTDPYDAVGGRVLNRAWFLCREIWQADETRARRRAAGQKAAATRRAQSRGEAA